MGLKKRVRFGHAGTFDNIVYLTGEPGDVLSPDPRPYGGGDHYEYIRRVELDCKRCAFDRGNFELYE